MTTPERTSLKVTFLKTRSGFSCRSTDSDQLHVKENADNGL